MDTQLIIAFSCIVGLIIGMCINKTGIKERDKKINELEKELIVKQNVAESLNETVQRLRKENERLKKKKGND